VSRPLVGLVVVGVGCSNFESIDDACKEKIGGDQHGSAEANQFFGRTTCYRRYAGLGQASIDKQITLAAASHATYLEANGISPDWNLEEPGSTGFTGIDSFERLEAAEFPIDASASFVWEVLIPIDEAADRGTVVDSYMHDPLVRDVLLAPGWLGGGYSEFTEQEVRYAYFHAVLAMPSGESTTRPATYPVDGQTDVPPSVTGILPLSGAPASPGYPITMTFGSVEGSITTSNPLGVRVDASTVTGPDGPVEHLVFLPGTYEWGTNWSTAVLLPTQPLQPDTTYVVSADVGWVTDPAKNIEFSFTTGSEAAVGPF